MDNWRGQLGEPNSFVAIKPRYNLQMVVHCTACDWSKNVPRKATRVQVYYKCHRCKHPITGVNVSIWAEWIDQHVDALEAKRREGKLGSRKQSLVESDREISAAGLGAEFAACVILSPWRLTEWLKTAGESKPNRGCDFPAHWFADGRPIEIKYTEKSRGHLLIRPPRNTRGPMRREYIDDSLYVLMTGRPYAYEAVGWAGKSDLHDRGGPNPVPITGRQRECWGIRATKLNPMETLFPLLSRR